MAIVLVRSYISMIEKITYN